MSAPVTRVLYPGSFDPIHNGHLEIIEVAARLFDDVVVAAVRNPQKGEPLFDLEDRQAMIEESVAEHPNVGADFIVKGLRVVTDFESELMQAQMNLAVSGVDTLFIPAGSTHSFVASKFIREIARYGGDVSSMVPEPVAKRLAEKYGD